MRYKYTCEMDFSFRRRLTLRVTDDIPEGRHATFLYAEGQTPDCVVENNIPDDISAPLVVGFTKLIRLAKDDSDLIFRNAVLVQLAARSKDFEGLAEALTHFITHGKMPDDYCWRPTLSSDSVDRINA